MAEITEGGMGCGCSSVRVSGGGGPSDMYCCGLIYRFFLPRTTGFLAATSVRLDIDKSAASPHPLIGVRLSLISDPMI